MRIVASVLKLGKYIRMRVGDFSGGNSVTKLTHVKAGVRVACWLFCLWKADFS